MSLKSHRLYRQLQESNLVEIDESKLDCQSCPQLKKAPERPAKCCHFQPFVANYLLGQMLHLHKDQPGGVQAYWNQLKASGHTLLPMGLIPHVEFQKQFFNGNSQDLVCTFYSKGQCSVWDSRPGVCIGYYCQSQHNTLGEQHWAEFSHRLQDLEYELCFHVLLETGYLTRDFEKQVCYMPDSQTQQSLAPTVKDLSRLWDHWYGREVEFYLRAYEEAKMWIRLRNEHRQAQDPNL